MQKVGIIIKRGEQKAVDLVGEVVRWLQKNKKEVIIGKKLAGLINFPHGFPEEKVPVFADLLIVLGGDGTLLKAARIIGDRNVPLLGVNLGNLGFLTEITKDEIFPVLSEIFEGKFHIDRRMKLSSHIIRNDKPAEEHSVLNDIVISKGGVARLFELETYIDGSYLTTFRADGLILSTPTGSTGYTLAAAGPIVHPGLNSIVITPICPHILTGRSIIVPADSTIRVALKPDDGEEDIILTMDGQVSVPLRPADEVVVNKSRASVCLIRPSRRDYFQVLRTKLKWKEVND